jgi:hypothetical protein
LCGCETGAPPAGATLRELVVADKPGRRKRSPTLASVHKAVGKAGIGVHAYRLESDGTITIVVGKPVEGLGSSPNTDLINPWDDVLKQ